MTDENKTHCLHATGIAFLIIVLSMVKWLNI